MKHSKTLISVGFILALALCNLHLFTADAASILCFDKTAVMNGEWWRIITHPLVHVSWYHLLLDVTAVAVLWYEIGLSSRLLKLLIACVCAAGSLIAATMFSPIVDQYGLCGLSGTAHGLMFFLGLWWIAEALRSKGPIQYARLITGIMLAAIVGSKSVFETVTGHVILSHLHTGELGIPIVESHFGGVFGGLLACIIVVSVVHTQNNEIVQTSFIADGNSH